MSTIRSNFRWCSDALEFTCWNGEVVRVAFALDCHDREVIGWVATTAGISGEMIRDMMVQLRRAALWHASARRIRCSGCPTTARSSPLTRPIEIALALNLVPCFTPVESPESNGMAEAFVKTFKRDYVRVARIPDADTALALIESWMEDYNTVHPHSRLGYRSPREYIALNRNPLRVRFDRVNSTNNRGIISIWSGHGAELGRKSPGCQFYVFWRSSQNSPLTRCLPSGQDNHHTHFSERTC